MISRNCSQCFKKCDFEINGALETLNFKSDNFIKAAGLNRKNTVCPLKLFSVYNLRNIDKFQRANVTVITVCWKFLTRH